MVLMEETGTARHSAVLDVLVRSGKLDDGARARVLRLSAEGGGSLGAILARLGLASEGDIAAAFADALGIAQIDAADFPDEPVLDRDVSPRFLKEAGILPVALTEETVVCAVADPLSDFPVRSLELMTRRRAVLRVAPLSVIEAAIDRMHGGGGTAVSKIVETIEGAEEEITEDVARLRDLASEAPVVRLVNLIIAQAVEARASDIHIEPGDNRLFLRYRIDGVLRDMDPPPARLRAAITSRIKLIARLNIAEQRLPQDGRVKAAVRGKELDIRVSTVPTMHGESIVMRLLNQGEVQLDLAALGFPAAVRDRYFRLLEQPNGILLVTGPTGSGKTTTLYASLMRLNRPETKILTVEDPVEYQIGRLNQIQVKPRIDLTFARILRSVLRQDPDIIMIGEIRDLETAQIAVQAALTGHLVLSTLHTNSAAGTITRLLDMGVADYLLTSTINGIVAQRLVRTLCPGCKTARPVLPELAAQLQLDRLAGGGPVTLHRGAGCPACAGLGYRGRTAVMEVMPITEPLRRAILRRAETAEIERVAIAEGMETMMEDGLQKALAGITTVEEVLRVCREA